MVRIVLSCYRQLMYLTTTFFIKDTERAVLAASCGTNIVRGVHVFGVCGVPTLSQCVEPYRSHTDHFGGNRVPNTYTLPAIQ